jgi:hypothetical protein
MTVAQTSLFAYDEHKETGKVGRQARLILSRMDFGVDYSRRELIKLTGLELSSICGRVNELLQVGLLKELEQRSCSVTKKKINPITKTQKDLYDC